jgi:hypothetical protein
LEAERKFVLFPSASLILNAETKGAREEKLEQFFRNLIRPHFDNFHFNLKKQKNICILLDNRNSQGI